MLDQLMVLLSVPSREVTVSFRTRYSFLLVDIIFWVSVGSSAWVFYGDCGDLAQVVVAMGNWLVKQRYKDCC